MVQVGLNGASCTKWVIWVKLYKVCLIGQGQICQDGQSYTKWVKFVQSESKRGKLYKVGHVVQSRVKLYKVGQVGEVVG